MARKPKDPDAPKAVLTDQQRAQLDKARAAGAVKRQENAILKKAAKQDEKEQQKKERQEKLKLAKDKLDGKSPPKPASPVVEEEPEKNEIIPEKIVDINAHKVEPNVAKDPPNVAKDPQNVRIVPPKKQEIAPAPAPTKKSQSAKEKYYEAKLEMLKKAQLPIEQPKPKYHPEEDAHTVAKNNLHSHFSKQIMADMWKMNFPHDPMPDKYL